MPESPDLPATQAAAELQDAPESPRVDSMEAASRPSTDTGANGPEWDQTISNTLSRWAVTDATIGLQRQLDVQTNLKVRADEAVHAMAADLEAAHRRIRELERSERSLRPCGERIAGHRGVLSHPLLQQTASLLSKIRDRLRNFLRADR